MSSTTKKLPPLWRCPRCGVRLVTSNLFHSCGRFTLKKLSARSDRGVFRLFKKFESLVRSLNEMQEFVRGRYGFSRFLAGFFVKGIPKLERWNKN